MKQSIVNMVKPADRKAIKDAWTDDDGYWLTLAPGYKAVGYYSARTIHEDSYKEMLEAIKSIEIVRE